MKQFFILVVLLVLTIPVFGQTELREVDLRVNGVGSGTPYATVVRRLGKPRRSKTERVSARLACTGSVETYLKLTYSGLEITLIGSGREQTLEVYSIVVTSKKWKASGITIGADLNDVVTKFGEPNAKEEQSGETMFNYNTKDNLGGVNFFFRNNKIVRMTMTETLC